MNELITACLVEGDIQPLTNFPQIFMSDFEVEVRNWILSYYRTYSVIPPLTRVQTEFSSFVPIFSEVHLPLGDVYELEVNSKKSTYATRQFEELLAKSKEGIVDTEALNELIQQVAVHGTSFSSYKTFDRSLYFRTGASLSTGLRLLDRAFGGIFDGELLLLVGRLGTGKSTFLQWRMNEWRKQGKRILCISKEMPAADVFMRLDGMSGHFNPLRLRVKPEDRKAKMEMEGLLSAVKTSVSADAGEIIIPKSQVYTASQILSLAKTLNVDLIVIDGIYHLTPDRKRGAATWEQVAAISGEIKEMAMDAHVPVIATTQLKRIGEREVFTAEDIAYSDALGQDADFVVAIRPLVDPRRTRTEIQIVKNRQGPVVTTILDIDFETMSFHDTSVLGDEYDD